MQKFVIERVANALNKEGIFWGIGGSHVLYKNGLGIQPNDIDLMIRIEDAKKAIDVMDRIAEEVPTERKAPFKTKSFKTYQMGSTSVDFMAGFALENDSGIYELILDQQSITYDHFHTPYTSLEDWFILYQLIPKKGEKADLIESYWKEYGVESPFLLERAFNQPLPERVKKRIHKCLSLKR
ncbi:nucleotidyltransferase family protein [Pseudalkalibacillus salsuginis]|uniref:nucleotidyltransferase family protein n=1 Tax=Pseudalkalibacillus salsuginis TaxID=2910972 RepID=UPI001F213E4E|nr:nucleotidyltransferase family protein [Pseudalkalibacillus salsuginis]MCF6411256.1 nucleotidyltransferase family protein [Pseudalkalibacillus salsuginis]